MCGGAGHRRLSGDSGGNIPRDALFRLDSPWRSCRPAYSSQSGGAVALNGRLEQLPSETAPVKWESWIPGASSERGRRPET